VTRQIDIRLGDVECTAVLHDEDAPILTSLLWDALPLHGEMRHVRWSGEAGYILADALHYPDPPDERRVSLYTPASIVLRSEHAELAFGYGQGQARDGFVRGAQGSHLATVITNVDQYLQRVAQTRHTGRTAIEITKREGE
jgi:hypothetical protein